MRYTNACVKTMSGNKQSVFCTFQDAPEHRFSGHPESPGRLRALRNWLENPPYSEIVWLEYSAASEAAVGLVHHQALIDFIKEEAQKGSHEIEPSPTYVTHHSFAAALGAVGATLCVSRKIIELGQGRGFAIIRPPGHHAVMDAAMGFCLFNNVAIAAADAVVSGVERVAIVDFDAHHGNGTEAVFWNTANVGYLSTHEADAYPGTGQMYRTPHAPGRIINIQVPAFSGKQVFKPVVDEIILPWLTKFKPAMVFVSAGYDGHFSDPLTTLTLDTGFYFDLTRKLVAWADAHCDGRLLFVLEGGYDSLALKDNIQASLAAMCGHFDYDDHYGDKLGPIPDAKEIIKLIIKQHNL